MTKTAFSTFGFTLIELLVSIGIGMILVMGGLAAYKGVGQKQAVKQAGVTFKTNLRAFQQKALSGEKPAGCVSLQGYRITYESVSSYQVQAICLVGSGSTTTFRLGEGVEFESSFSDIEFSTTETSIVGAPWSIVLLTPTGSYEYQVRVEGSGVISGLML